MPWFFSNSLFNQTVLNWTQRSFQCGPSDLSPTAVGSFPRRKMHLRGFLLDSETDREIRAALVVVMERQGLLRAQNSIHRCVLHQRNVNWLKKRSDYHKEGAVNNGWGVGWGAKCCSFWDKCECRRAKMMFCLGLIIPMIVVMAVIKRFSFNHMWGSERTWNVRWFASSQSQKREGTSVKNTGGLDSNRNHCVMSLFVTGDKPPKFLILSFLYFECLPLWVSAVFHLHLQLLL